MFVCCECRVLSGRGLCDELITRPEESYRMWCVVVCELENLRNEEAMTRVGSLRKKKKMIKKSLFVRKAYYVRQCHSVANTAISSHLQNLKHEKKNPVETRIFARL